MTLYRSTRWSRLRARLLAGPTWALWALAIGAMLLCVAGTLAVDTVTSRY